MTEDVEVKDKPEAAVEAPTPLRELRIVTDGDQAHLVVDTMGRYECQAILTSMVQRVSAQINALAQPPQLPAEEDEPDKGPEEEAAPEA